MTGIVVGVETDKIALKNTEKELFSDGQDSVDFGGGEGSMEEKADLDILLGVTDFLSEHGG